MKTFETEKHNIPEGATHYRDECEDFEFSWVMFDDGELMVDTIATGWSRFKHPEFEAKVKPIPQTNIETPEEKEVLDLIDATPRQYESVASKEVEWVNGELLEFNGEPCIFIGMSEGFPVVKYTNDADSTLAGEIDEIFATDMLSKIETEAERVERERLESGKALHSQASKTEVATEFGIFRLWEMEDKETRDHYCQLAERINYRKESE